ncbi:VENN motif pre-toxin domain-containing protein, partial [Xenorhabdus sp. PR6a]|uniref:VENN motif pre-toxin domain-containing protein n=1 Tax=Xenorhabdus sp. PR6a TaxID=3025877 RepID=UPI0023585581
AGAVGAASGELAASAIAGALYGGKTMDELSPDEKEKVSNLSTIAGGLVAGLATDSTAGGVDGAQTAKNAVEANYLSADQITSWLEKYRAASTDEERNRLVEVASKADQDQQRKAVETRITKDYLEKQQKELINLVQSSGCDADCRKLAEYSINQLTPVIDNYETWQKTNNIPRAAIATITLALPALSKAAAPAVSNWFGSTTIANRAIGVGTTGLANAGMQGYNIYENPDIDFSYASFGTALVTGGITPGMGYWGTTTTNTLGAGVSSVIDGQSPWVSMGGAFLGSSVGYGVTIGTTNYFDGKINPWSNGFKERFSLINPYISAPPLVSPIPNIAGSVGGAFGAEVTNKVVTDELNSNSKDKK